MAATRPGAAPVPQATRNPASQVLLLPFVPDPVRRAFSVPLLD
ncbi:MULTISPECIES: hypothetical protein [Streptomyces]|nr:MULTISPECIES: hypothetical protein [Streptomyces]